MPVPARITDLSATAASNSPAGTDPVGPNLDDYLRGIQAVMRGDLATKGADIASATTTDLGAVQGSAHDITGTTTITSFGTVASGIAKLLKFEGALTLTHHATSLILPGGESITTADGDTALVVSEGSGNWRCWFYWPAAINPSKTVSTDETQTLTNKTLTSPAINGTVTTSGLTLPGFSAGAIASSSMITGTALTANSAVAYKTVARVTSEDAQIAFYASNGSTLHGLLNSSANSLEWYDSTPTRRFRVRNTDAEVAGDFIPSTDNTYTLGGASNGWKEIFSDNATINTSDARKKTVVSTMSAAEIAASKALAKEIGTFQFLASVVEKGAAARLHIGMTVQRAIAVMESHGLDPFRYSFICYDEWEDQYENDVLVRAAGNKYGFRVHELLLFIARGIEARLSALEG